MYIDTGMGLVPSRIYGNGSTPQEAALDPTVNPYASWWSPVKYASWEAKEELGTQVESAITKRLGRPWITWAFLGTILAFVILRK